MDILENPLPVNQFDLIWYHPPYWDIIKYSENPKDLSNCVTLHDYEDKLNRSVEMISKVVRPSGVMAILIGDKRKSGNYYMPEQQYQLQQTSLMAHSTCKNESIFSQG